MLTNRIINSSLGGCTISKTVSMVIPQGGVLSPLLLFVVIIKIPVSFDQLRIKKIAYADDVVVRSIEVGTPKGRFGC